MRTLCLVIWAAGIALAQSTKQPVTVTIDVENYVLYRGNVFDAAKLAKDPGMTTSVNQAFISGVNVGDIVAVNGKPAKGLWTMTFAVATPYRAQPMPGQLIADVDASATFQCVSHI